MEIYKKIFQSKCYNCAGIVELVAGAFIPRAYIRILKILDKYIFVVYTLLNFITKLHVEIVLDLSKRPSYTSKR